MKNRALSNVNRVPSAFTSEANRLMNHSGNSQKPNLKIFDPQLEIPIEGFEHMRGNAGYAKRRDWVPLNQKLFNEVSSNSKKLQALLREALEKVFSDVNRIGRLSVVSLGVDEPYFGGRPEKFIILSSSDRQAKDLYQQSFSCEAYPEILEAVRLQSPIFAADVRRVPAFEEVLPHFEKSGARSLLTVPLMNADRPYALVKFRLPYVEDKGVFDLLTDLTRYCQELSPFISYYDFFQRTYRGMNK